MNRNLFLYLLLFLVTLSVAFIDIAQKRIAMKEFQRIKKMVVSYRSRVGTPSFRESHLNRDMESPFLLQYMLTK